MAATGLSLLSEAIISFLCLISHRENANNSYVASSNRVNRVTGSWLGIFDRE